jgi:hypothetical protein
MPRNASEGRVLPERRTIVPGLGRLTGRHGSRSPSLSSRPSRGSDRSLERQGIPREFTTKSRVVIISNDCGRKKLVSVRFSMKVQPTPIIPA